ncbi:hypothetical protein PAEAM_56690 [Paenibacillus sp. GM1FR]|uniref:hypothetical protein n=1 Tax=Paenibacillus sp. GM1FR TaxID=2059267 RepID=UPI000C27A0A7|nr:hypothetical protein [Paenibacillus sp. GM1FR]PJN48807.1 hypothetical protein PAEAM_56690 [Paenibacillus sp. GM1FR]
MKKKIIGGIIAILIVSFLLQLPNNLRYKVENVFGNSHTFFYGMNLGIMIDDVGGGYDEEVNLDDQANPTVDLTKYRGDKVDMFIYGRYVNSAEPLLVVLNDKVLYNDQPQREMAQFYSKYYIKKHFVVNLTETLKNGRNNLLISTGKVTEKYVLHITK